MVSVGERMPRVHGRTRVVLGAVGGGGISFEGRVLFIVSRLVPVNVTQLAISQSRHRSFSRAKCNRKTDSTIIPCWCLHTDLYRL